MNFKFALVKNAPENARLPKRSTIGSAGYDFVSPETFTLQPGEKHMVWTGVKAYMLENFVLLAFIRSSMGVKRSLALANGTMVIDRDYADNPDNDGNIGICLYNYGTEPQTINKGDRIAQGLFVPIFITDDDDTTTERVGGYGSTGR